MTEKENRNEERYFYAPSSFRHRERQLVLSEEASIKYN